MTIERHYSPATLAELLDCHPETLRRAAARGELASVRVGKDRRFPESAVLDWLRSREEVRRATGRVISLDRQSASG
jgi:excisionase family DNA binding protein